MNSELYFCILIMKHFFIASVIVYSFKWLARFIAMDWLACMPGVLWFEAGAMNHSFYFKTDQTTRNPSLSICRPFRCWRSGERHDLSRLSRKVKLDVIFGAPRWLLLITKNKNKLKQKRNKTTYENTALKSMTANYISKIIHGCAEMCMTDFYNWITQLS